MLYLRILSCFIYIDIIYFAMYVVYLVGLAWKGSKLFSWNYSGKQFWGCYSIILLVGQSYFIYLEFWSMKQVITNYK